MRSLVGRPDLCAINTATLGFQAPIEETIDAIAREGFGGIAPWRREIEARDTRAIAKRIRDAGLAVTDYCRSIFIPALRPCLQCSEIEPRRADSLQPGGSTMQRE